MTYTFLLKKLNKVLAWKFVNDKQNLRETLRYINNFMETFSFKQGDCQESNKQQVLDIPLSV